MSSRSAPLVSVVTPFYNTASYLAECIESVLGQSYKNFEYILVDNQSTDGSAEIAQRYAAQDSRIRLIRNPTFLNQVQNYNRALSLISESSNYTKVVEADNWIYPECLVQMVALGERHARIVVVGAYSVTEAAVRFQGLPISVTVIDGRDMARMQMLGHAYLFGAPTTVLLRSSAVRSRNPFFEEETWLAEDVSACWELLRFGDFGFVHQVLTFVRTQNEGTILSGRRAFDGLELTRLAVLTRHGPKLLDPEEYHLAHRRTSGDYYNQLGRGWLAGAGTEFWAYHRAGLAELRMKLEYWRLAIHVLGILIRALGSPGHYLMAAVRWIGRGRHA